MVEKWECDFKEPQVKPTTFTKTFLHTILYDFKAFGDKNERKEPTGTLTFENAHMLISVSALSATLSNPHPRTSARKTRKSFAASLWKSWSGGGIRFENKRERSSFQMTST